MKKDKFIKSIIILIFGGFITKILGMLIKIIMNRLVGIEGISLYMLIFPTFSLFVCLANLSLPTSVSKLVSEDKYNNKKLIFSSLPIIFVSNLLLIILILLIAPFITKYFFHDSRCYLPIISIALVLPFESISNLLRGYFFGKQKMIPHVISHITEQIVRLLLIVLIIPRLVTMSITYAVSFLIIVNMFSEFVSIFILLIFIPKKNLVRSDFKIDKSNIKNILALSIPTTGSRLIGNIGYFLEPIIITFVLRLLGYSNNYITIEYGIICGYVMPLLLLPSFFSNAISQALIPIISNSYSNHNYNYTKKKIKQGILFSLLIGIPCTILFLLFPGFFLNLIYNTKEGIKYIYLIAPFFLLLYIETPLASSLQAMGKVKDVFSISLKSTIFRTLSLFIILFLNIGIWGFVLAQIITIIYTNILYIKTIKKEFI